MASLTARIFAVAFEKIDGIEAQLAIYDGRACLHQARIRAGGCLSGVLPRVEHVDVGMGEIMDVARHEFAVAFSRGLKRECGLRYAHN